ncbi:gas vesicle protein [Kribbella sp. CA-253562]|uniref:gas vesicle protein GvpO n=1 Tax=Kribbella sp. CA-253562 TaxID=3239942 RepID=UPI003D8A2FEE
MATARKSAPSASSPGRRPVKKAARKPPDDGSGQAQGNGGGRSRRPSLRTIALSAAAELADLIGQQPEGIVAVDKTEDGWQVQVEVVESRRIPETTDLLAVYEVDVDADGSVTGYRRLNRYVRGRVQE